VKKKAEKKQADNEKSARGDQGYSISMEIHDDKDKEFEEIQTCISSHMV
jgi:hypothetical protein